MQSIVTAFNDPGDANGIKQVQSTGFHVAGDRYVALRSDDRSLYGKKVRTKKPLQQCSTDNTPANRARRAS